jgi:predicted nucleic acid-binding protein
MGDRDFVDTKILLHSMQDGNPGKQAAARRVLERARDGSLVISTQVLMEFYAAATGKLVPRLPVPVAAEAVRQFAELPVVSVTPSLVLAAVGRSHGEGISIWDALIVESALSAGCTRLLTEDLKGKTEFDGMRVVNPYRGEMDRVLEASAKYHGRTRGGRFDREGRSHSRA